MLGPDYGKLFFHFVILITDHRKAFWQLFRLLKFYFQVMVQLFPLCMKWLTAVNLNNLPKLLG